MDQLLFLIELPGEDLPSIFIVMEIHCATGLLPDITLIFIDESELI
jgi:hypothetical protein